MFGIHLTEAYGALLHIGLVKSKRDFSRTFLGHHWTYLRDVQQRDREEFRVPAVTVMRLKGRLRDVSQYLSPRLRHEVGQVISQIDQHASVIRTLGYGRRNR